jgi:hypothetical protein
MGDYTEHLGEWYPVFVKGAAATMSSRSSAVASSVREVRIAVINGRTICTLT